jgi:hypothetical protein
MIPAAVLWKHGRFFILTTEIIRGIFPPVTANLPGRP